ncbi:MAG: GYD domain-containing protein [Tepidiformaceae bacterium]
MPKYLIAATYTEEGSKGLLKDGGTARRTAVEEMAKGLGGSVEAFYFAFGSTDVFVIMDMPSDVAAAAASIAVGAAGGATVDVTPLLTPAQIDEAADAVVKYRAPGE